MILFRSGVQSRQHICVKSSSNPGQRTFAIVVEPLVGRITNVRNFGNHYALGVEAGGEEIPTGCSSSRVSCISFGTSCP